MTLIFACETKRDFENLNKIIEKSKYHASAVNYEFRSLYFDCSNQADADSLESELQKLIDKNEISGHFELED